MDIIKLIIIFATIMIVLRFKKPLYISIGSGIIVTIIIFGIGPKDAVLSISQSVISQDMLVLVLAFYSITFLQRMLEERDHLTLAEESLSNLFNSRRVNAMVAPFIIGMLPSPGAVLIAAPIVDTAGGDYISMEEKTFITSYFRHISESFMPTYASIILALSLSGIGMTDFVVGMLPMVVLLFILGYFFYIRKIPKETGLPESKDKKQDIKNIIISLWTIVLATAIILIFNMQVYIAVIPIIIISTIVNRFKVKEILPFFISAFETKIIFNTAVIMGLKGILTFTGVIGRLPAYFSVLPIPPSAIFAAIFLIGTIVAGSQAMIALGIPLAFATIPDGGVALLVLLMSMTYIAMQISPTHICLAIITEHNKTSFIDLIKNTMPIFIIFIIASILYSYLLTILL